MSAFGPWRSRLYDEPSPHRFRQLCWMGLEVEPTDFQLIWLPYALEHLRSWPDATRVAPLDSRVRHTVMSDAPSSVLQMVARLVSPASVAPSAWLEAILNNNQLCHVTILELDARGGQVLCGEDIAKLARWPGLERLHTLSLIGHELTDDDLAPLLESNRLKALRRLNLNNNRLTSETPRRLAQLDEPLPLTSLHMEQAAVTLSALEELMASPLGERLEALHVEPLPSTFLTRLQPARTTPWSAFGPIELEEEEGPGVLVASGALSELEEVCVEVEGSWDAWPVLSSDATPKMRRLAVSCHTVCDIIVDPGMWERWVASSRVDQRLSQLAFDLEPGSLEGSDAVLEVLTTWVRLFDAPTVLRVDDIDISPPWRTRAGGAHSPRLMLQWLALDGERLANSAQRQVYVGRRRGVVDPRMYQALDAVDRLEWSTPRVKMDNLEPLLRAPLWSGLDALTLISSTGDSIEEDAWRALRERLAASSVRRVGLHGFQWLSGVLEELVPSCPQVESLELQMGGGWQRHRVAPFLQSLDSSGLTHLGLCGVPQHIPDGILLLMLDIELPRLKSLDLSGRCWHPSTLEVLLDGLPLLGALRLSLKSYQERLAWADEIEARFPVIWSDHPELTPGRRRSSGRRRS